MHYFQKLQLIEKLESQLLTNENVRIIIVRF